MLADLDRGSALPDLAEISNQLALWQTWDRVPELLVLDIFRASPASSATTPTPGPACSDC